MTSQRPLGVGRALGALSAALRAHAAMALGVCGVAGIGAHHLLDEGRPLWLAACLYVVAALLFLLLFHREAMEPRAVESVNRRRALPGWLMLVACVSGGLAFMRFQGNQFGRDATALWAVGLFLLGLSAWSPPVAHSEERVPGERTLSQGGVAVNWVHLSLVGIMLIGAFYRLHKIVLNR